MKHAAIGIRAHSGWGAVVVLAGRSTAIELIDRRRIAITDPNLAGANQPYHFAQGQELPEAEAYLAGCAALSQRLALQGLGEVVDELRRRDCIPVGCAILLASGRRLPPLAQILDSHPLIHTAEGEFFRQAFWKACDRLEIPVTGIRERDLNGQVEFREKIAALGKSAGPPWTADQKLASLAAMLVLQGGTAGNLVAGALAKHTLSRSKH